MGNEAINVAAEYGNAEVVAFLLTDDRVKVNKSCFTKAAFNNQIKVVELFLDSGKMVNFHWESTMIECGEREKLEMTQYLYGRSSKDSKMNLFYRAVNYYRKNLVKFMLEPDQKNPDAATLVEYANTMGLGKKLEEILKQLKDPKPEPPKVSSKFPFQSKR
eukprot:TRINITY_DN2781_c0_g1_i2.p1 TRINITY_DN2781_c0_g1~~TRINITY_DN2781_c0_g1_i2.p1  ORF type:complete len:161 (-),score=44.80 TRINITY_DN2781_c0_g1_i2:56-538(-)